MRDFIAFIKKQGVVGLTVGFILGGSVSKLVASLVEDLVNPILGIILGTARNLSSYSLVIGSAEVRWGNFLAILIDFLVIALVVFFIFRFFDLEKLDGKAEAQKELKKKPATT